MRGEIQITRWVSGGCYIFDMKMKEEVSLCRYSMRCRVPHLSAHMRKSLALYCDPSAVRYSEGRRCWNTMSKGCSSSTPGGQLALTLPPSFVCHAHQTSFWPPSTSTTSIQVIHPYIWISDTENVHVMCSTALPSFSH